MAGQKTPSALGTESIGKLLMQYAVPAIIAMTASSLYNMVDSIFIGHGVGTMAISGLALTFPLMNLAAAFGSLVGVGVHVLFCAYRAIPAESSAGEHRREENLRYRQYGDRRFADGGRHHCYEDGDGRTDT